ncbi:DUF3145 domain-containing protein [Buchananella hordeovulneris]|uniref:Uncharacterized protein n=1 Tax=Buchananella hordeovulneris TaxID=52770 RepID=A0A1Q5PXD6_9ACTO|nr:DUF3145 domain-containing protein [Buchananella hordeovulneris]MDO5080342.1 DUF3145 domain-containing protein [Buchananella hordeovulneris]OKL52166.1 hypothetical protein BSZ40_04505 [Buchananella hordeovulneris]RRD44895.1 DUF3145 domain-containing protein [Buchananella hordeovulneris]RRD52479.1 DUF3145 domain-containing protein [Buchananella hordeovulneris]
MDDVSTRGVFFVHAVPHALTPHVEWAIGAVLGYDVKLSWTAQPAEPGTVRAELSWVGPVGTGARLASALNGWGETRYEVTEDGTVASVGARWSHTPELGIFHAQVDIHGNIVIPENRLRALIEVADNADLLGALALALGQDWDDDLEPYRYAGESAPVRWLHKVG